jgi:dihydropteroate synthase
MKNKANLILPKIWGILNITPDSFSDGNKYFTEDSAINQAISLLNDGAEVIDIGAESTRPGAINIPWQTEWSRLKNILPIIKQEAQKKGALVSLDSHKANTIEKALPYIDIINDVSGLNDHKILSIVKESKLPTILMHHLSIPADVSITLSDDVDPIDVIIGWFKQKVDFLSDFGISENQIILDPGIGFGTKPKQSLYILSNIAKMHCLNLPILVGHSRKGFLRLFNHGSQQELDINTSVFSLYLSTQQVQHIRVHNVLMHRQILNVYSTILSN